MKNKTFLKNYLYLLILSNRHVTSTKTYEYEDASYIDEIEKLKKEIDNGNFFTQFRKSFFQLMPKVLDFEGRLFNTRNIGKSNILNLWFPYLREIGIEYPLGVNLQRTYWRQLQEEITIDLSHKYMVKTTNHLVSKIGNIIKYDNIYRKINPDNYFFKNLIISSKNRKIFHKMFYILKLSTRQKLIYFVGAPGMGKTTMVIDQLLRKGYRVFYLNGNNILLSDEGEETIVRVLDNLKQKI
jgi:hypothetical protein